MSGGVVRRRAMALQRILTGDSGRTGAIYLAIGGISLAKAIALRDDRERFRRELADAALFLGVGLVLRRYSTMKAQKREELRESVPAWILGGEGTEPRGGFRDRAIRRFRSEPEPEPEPTIADRARRMMAD